MVEKMRCIVPEIDDAIFSPVWKEALGDRYFTGALVLQGSPSSNTILSWEPEGASAAARGQPVDRGEVDEARRSVEGRRTGPRDPRSNCSPTEAKALLPYQSPCRSRH